MNNVNWTFQQQGAIELAFVQGAIEFYVQGAIEFYVQGAIELARVKAPDGTLDSSVDLATRQFASKLFF